MVRVILFIVLLSGVVPVPATSAEYAVAVTPAPVLNTPDFALVFGGASGQDMKTDRCGQVRELEYIALPGTVFTVLKKLRSGTADIYQVATDDYPVPQHISLYVDRRFLKLEGVLPEPRRAALPSRQKIVASLRKEVGKSYVWGGNVPDGVPELAAWFYRTAGSNSGRHILSGLDCSGLLYHATGGWTPRNTSRLITYGTGVAIAGKNPADIAALLQPLDLIVWNGHVVMVLDRETVIESRLSCDNPARGDVVLTPLTQRIAEVMRTRRPVNAWPGGKKQQDIFVVRRWYPERGGSD